MLPCGELHEMPEEDCRPALHGTSHENPRLSPQVFAFPIAGASMEREGEGEGEGEAEGEGPE